MIELVTDKAKFIRLVSSNTIRPALKSYNDTLLFYYLGHLALQSNTGNILEIGPGGSTYPLLELSEVHNRTFNIVDISLNVLDYYSDQQKFPGAHIVKHCINSKILSQESGLENLSYCHIDGSKIFNTTLSDLEFCHNTLATNGLICQDDYGNNKWPTVTDAVQTMIQNGKLKMLIVGDSSAWLTDPKYYDYWMDIIENDYELSCLRYLLNFHNSSMLHKSPKYWFMNAALAPSLPQHKLDEAVFDYYDKLIEHDIENYLKMPYRVQSTIGIHLRKHLEYALMDSWDTLKGNNWPTNPPKTKEDIDNLPNHIKDELINLHKIDLYAQIIKVANYCVRDNKHSNTK